MQNWRKSLELLNSTLDGMSIPRRVPAKDLNLNPYLIPKNVPYTRINDTYYPVERVVDIGKANSTPKETYSSSNPNIMWSSSRYTPLTELAFQTRFTNSNGSNVWSYSANEGIGLNPTVTSKDVLSEFPKVVDFLHSNAGAGLYSNTPVGGLTGVDSKRARLYRRSGFKDVPELGKQVLDTRRRYGKPELMDAVYNIHDSLVLHPLYHEALINRETYPEYVQVNGGKLNIVDPTLLSQESYLWGRAEGNNWSARGHVPLISLPLPANIPSGFTQQDRTWGDIFHNPTTGEVFANNRVYAANDDEWLPF